MPEFSLGGMRVSACAHLNREIDFHSPLVGPPHIYNTLAAVASGLALGYSLDVITTALEKCTGAPGRFERVPHDGDFAVVVDYAHSDDALLNVLRTAREVTRGRIITLFGCGGDRDRFEACADGRSGGFVERCRDSDLRQSAHRRSKPDTLPMPRRAFKRPASLTRRLPIAAKRSHRAIAAGAQQRSGR